MSSGPKADGEHFGEMLGLVVLKGLDPKSAVDVAVREFGGNREKYKEIAERHWQD